ncbi:hypothetical protein CC1G_04799 [Coprinopsis cinerea okayama7|uniref:Uncharacterized protein n=1 Tax=Coprinopsis cinerea (strain Okayama-7 / 130 / ATCC MYA-4618 / FGSC 9003) TaxID=240176 RepID=A8P2L7_COPC7|nr:hypothetical protein CC1G_04799 [Coprinopsis cinerea okayama7\|eukprot:XP_001838355.1 hypothetical protein CC1G_04799 [Coprinopsis cinerea okayama7\
MSNQPPAAHHRNNPPVTNGQQPAHGTPHDTETSSQDGWAGMAFNRTIIEGGHFAGNGIYRNSHVHLEGPYHPLANRDHKVIQMNDVVMTGGIVAAREIYQNTSLSYNVTTQSNGSQQVAPATGEALIINNETVTDGNYAPAVFGAESSVLSDDVARIHRPVRRPGATLNLNGTTVSGGIICGGRVIQQTRIAVETPSDQYSAGYAAVPAAAPAPSTRRIEN